MSRRYGVTTPVLDTIASVLNGSKTAIVAVEELMTRSAREEFSF